MNTIENKLLNQVQSYKEMNQIMKSCLSPKDFKEFKELEDALTAWEGCYYDTHDLNYIENNLEEYKEKYLNFIELVIKIMKITNEQLNEQYTIVSIL